MKRILSVVLLVLVLTLLLTGCGEKDRILFKSAKLKDFVKLAEYKGIEVDTKSDDFEEFYDDVIKSDVENNDLYVKKTEGTVASGDTVNIDYVGKKDGVAFDGGTAQGYDLEIGSGSFIPGFEDGLIGKEIGTTVDLNLTFPESYKSEELAGKAVVFTVTINYVKTTEAKKAEDYYKDLNFKSLEAYEKDVRERAIDGYLLDKVINKSTVKDYPKADAEILTEALTAMMERNLTSYGMTLDAYLSQSGKTKDDLNKTLLEEQVYPLMKEMMPLYAILDAEKITVTKDEANAKIEEMIKEYGSGTGVTSDMLKEYYNEYYFENMVVTEKAVSVIKENAKIK